MMHERPVASARATAVTVVLTLMCAIGSAARAGAQAQPVPVTSAKPGWQWSFDSAQTVVNAVRAGRDLSPATWPGGAKAAVLLSFDVDNETVTIRYGETSVGALSMGQYGARVGLERVVKLLDGRKIPASFFIPSVSLSLHPEMGPLIAKSGRNEIAVHGWVHEMNVTLPDSAEELQFELRTKGGSRILWGRSPEARHPGEIDLTRKLQRLRELHSRFGNPDNQQDQWQIDIRPWQGVRRDILSSAPVKDSAKN